MVDVLEMKMNVSEVLKTQEEVCSIFNSLSVTQLIDSFFLRCFWDRVMPNLTSKLVGVISYLFNVHFNISTSQDKEIILVKKSGVDHLIILPYLYFSCKLLSIPLFVLKFGRDSIFNIISILQDGLLLYSPIVEPCPGILVPTPLELEVGVLVREK